MSTRTNANRIRQFRVERGYSQERLAEKAGLGNRTIQRAEVGESIHSATAGAIAKAFNVSVGDLIEPPLLSLSPRDLRRQMDSRFREIQTSTSKAIPSKHSVEILDIVSASAREGEPGSTLVVELIRILQGGGFNASYGFWSEDRFLAKRAHNERDSLFVIHGHNKVFADRLSSIIERLNIGADVFRLSASDASKESIRVAPGDILKYDAALVAFRAA